MSKKNSRTYNSIRNIFFSVANQFTILILNFINRGVFIKILGAEYLGVNGLFSDILIMLSLADLGIATAMVYSFYKPLSINDKDKISALINFYKKIYNGIAAFIFVIGISLTPFINLFVKLNNPVPNLKIYYILFLLNSVISYLWIYKSSIINADQKGYIVSMYSTIFNILRIIIQTIFLIINKSYGIYLIIQILCTFINNICLSYKANKLYPYINNNIDLEKKEKVTIIDNIKSVFLYKASNVLINGTDNIIISLLVGTVSVGYYSNYNMIVGTISKFIWTAFNSLTASVGNLFTNNNVKKRYEIFSVMQMISFILSGISCVGVYVLIDEFIRLWIGNQYVLDDFTLIAILSNFYLACVLPPILSFREAIGLFKKTKYVMVIAAIINLILSLILGKVLGIAGVIMSSTIAKLLTYFWYEPVLLFGIYFDKPVKKYFQMHLQNLLIVIILIVITKYLTNLIVVSGIIGFILKAIFCVFIPLLVYLIIYIKTKEFNIILKKINKNKEI